MLTTPPPRCLKAPVDVTWPMAAVLAAVAAVAGFIDAIAGGGGLLTLPAVFMAGVPPHLALGTNKGQSFAGSGMALWRFWRSPLLDRERAVASFPAALLGAAGGVALVSLVPPAVLRPLVMALLAAVAVSMLVRRPVAQDGPRVRRPAWLAAAVALAMGGYDGFFGPGTGTFLIMAYALLWKDRLDEASANAKVANFASNLAALAGFAWQGAVLWQVALPMAVGQAAGSHLGAHVTLKRGQALVRAAVVCVSLALVARMAWQVLAS